MRSSRRCKVNAAIVSLLRLLPPDITELWWDTRDLSAFLRWGGIHWITAERLSRALSSASHHTAATPWKCRLWRNKRYYLLGNRSEAFTPKAQFEHFQNPRHHLPTLLKDYFLVNTRVCVKFLEDITTGEPSLIRNCKTRSMTVSHKDKEEGDNESHTSDKEEGEKEVLPMSPKGYKLVSIDQETNFVNALQQHAMSCQCQMVVENSSKWGFEVKDSYVCQKCNHRINYRASNYPVTFSTFRHVFDVPLRFQRPVTFSTFRHVFDVPSRFRRPATFSTFRHVFDVLSRFRRPVPYGIR
jgi:hypothetical protein